MGMKATYAEIKNELKARLSKYIERRTGRKPMIIPVIMETR